MVRSDVFTGHLEIRIRKNRLGEILLLCECRCYVEVELSGTWASILVSPGFLRDVQPLR